MATNVVWVSTVINSRTIAIQYFFCDLFYFLKGTDIASYADDTTPYNANFIQEQVINKLEESSLILFKWFNNNYLKEKSHVLISVNKVAIANIANTVSNLKMYMSELLGIAIDSIAINSKFMLIKFEKRQAKN